MITQQDSIKHDVVADGWGGLTSKNKREESLAQSLTQDLNVGVDYACK